jgi:hypothetical protein
MSEQMVKVKASHQIVHDGQVLLPGTVVSVPVSLADEWRKAGAIEEPGKDEQVTVLKPVLGEPVVLSPLQVKLAADKKRLDDAAKQVKEDEQDDDDGDGLKGK